MEHNRIVKVAVVTQILLSVSSWFVDGFTLSQTANSKSWERTFSRTGSRPTSTRIHPLAAAASDDDNDGVEKKDLLDYFDPLLSPHAYPNGIDANKSSSSSSSGNTNNVSDKESFQNEEQQRVNLGTDFDPLLSPHAYPNGIDAAIQSSSSSQESNPSDNEWTPFKIRNAKADFAGSSKSDYATQKSEFTIPWSTSVNSVPSTPSSSSSSSSSKKVPDEAFDPRISPHAYPRGTNAKPISTKSNQSNKETTKTTIGILLIDHGSKRQSSNDRLQSIANLYQSKLSSSSSSSSYIVQHAHMEIAKPSISDGMKYLVLERGVRKVVCTPYFLSPGRHVLEDIPSLIQSAVAEIEVELLERVGASEDDEDGGLLEVVTTEAVGSSMESMVGLIGGIVDGALGIDREEEEWRRMEGERRVRREGDGGEKEGYELGGFFGNVKRMMDEQL